MLPVPADVAYAGSCVAQWLGQRELFDETSLALTGAYDELNELYSDLPTVGDPALDMLFRDRLGPLDAYLIVARAR